MENPQCAKTTVAYRLQKIPLRERNTLSRKRRGNDLSSSSSPHAAAVTMRRQRPLSLYTFTHSIHIHNSTTTIQHKSYLYSYHFQTIYTYSPRGLSGTYSHMCPFQPVGGGYHRAFNHPVLIPSRGTCFPTMTWGVHERKYIQLII